MRTTNLIAATLVGCLLLTAVPAHADDVADVKAAEMAFNDAQNAGKLDAMQALALNDRTVYPPFGGELIVGWDPASNARRQAAFDAGRKISWRIDRLEVRVNGDSAVTTFERLGTIRETDGTVRDSHTRNTGVWIRQAGQWKLAHRHESPF
jgi:ketosteroid isomerase-like protein